MNGYRTIAAVIGAGLVLAATPAEARRSKRTGLNFGASVRLLDTNERIHAGNDSDKNTKTTSSSQAISPYVGYAFDALNLGLSFSAETRTSENVENSDDNLTTTNRNKEQSRQGASLFARFNFGSYFYFEAGGGLYQEKTSVSQEIKRLAAQGPTGEFAGERESYQVRAAGPGYHLAGGVELPMGGGFFFTSSYQVRMVQLRDYEGGSNLGKKRSQTQSREVMFGLAHYTR